MTDIHTAGDQYLNLARDQFRTYKKLAERALEQVSDEDLHWRPDSESNTLAVQITHLAGNMRSRWRDFLTSDGEKADRQRDQEFIDDARSRDELMRVWEHGWKQLFDTVDALTAEDLGKTVTTRGREHSVMEAVNGQLAHYAYHVGQIVYIARHRAAASPGGDSWTSLSIPKAK